MPKGNPNPSPDTRFGGERANPQSPGGWRKEMVFSYQYRRFMNMTIEELSNYAKLPEKDRTVVEDLAYQRVLSARMSLADVREITDRTEGKAPQSLDITSGGEKFEPIAIYDFKKERVEDDEDS